MMMYEERRKEEESEQNTIRVLVCVSYQSNIRDALPERYLF